MTKYLVAILILVCNAAWAHAEPRECSWHEVVDEYGYADILHSSFSQKIIESVRWYGGTSGYKEINSYLRGLSKPGLVKKYYLKKHMGDLDFVIDSSHFPLDCYLYRGMSLAYRGNKPFETGEIVSDHAYQSSSVERRIAEGTFARKTESKNLTSLFVIYHNFEQKGLLVGNGEAEVLLPRRSFFKIIKSVMIASKNYVLAFRCRDENCEDVYQPTQLPKPFGL